jgi:hypothetical protein
MRNMIKERDAMQYSSLPSITLLLATTLWSGYTQYIVPTTQMYFANFPGMFFAAGYLFTFAWFSDQRRRLMIFGAMAAIEIVGWSFYGGMFVNNVPNAVSITGTVTVATNLTFFASPLKQLVGIKSSTFEYVF